MTLFPGIEGCAVIAEVAQSHEGSLDAANGYIDAIAGAGAHGVKFQTHIAAAEHNPARVQRRAGRLRAQTEAWTGTQGW